MYRLPLPNYPGALHDEVVIASDELGFATRGGFLIAFNVSEGKELWRWDSDTDDVSVLAALADDSCLVQTPTHVIDVWSPTRAKVDMSGKAMLAGKDRYIGSTTAEYGITFQISPDSSNLSGARP